MCVYCSCLGLFQFPIFMLCHLSILHLVSASPSDPIKGGKHFHLNFIHFPFFLLGVKWSYLRVTSSYFGVTEAKWRVLGSYSFLDFLAFFTVTALCLFQSEVCRCFILTFLIF